MARPIKNPRPKLDLETEALAALEQARAMPPGRERTEAMKRAGILQNAADMQGLLCGAARRRHEFPGGSRTGACQLVRTNSEHARAHPSRLCTAPNAP